MYALTTVVLVRSYSGARGSTHRPSPGRIETGTQVVLEAMAAGKAVIATRLPALAEVQIEVDGITRVLAAARAVTSATRLA